MASRYLGNKRLLLMITLLVGAAFACNAPSANDAPTPTSTATPSPMAESPEVTPPGAPETIPAAVGEPENGPEPGTPTPSNTPASQPSLAATVTLSSTPTRVPTSTRRPQGPSGSATPTRTPDLSAGPLKFDYHISWTLSKEKWRVAIATVTIVATGGGGGYSYFRDDLLVDGPIFEYEWATCSGNPGSLRVDSANGQSVRTDYFENPPCPTPTPTSSP